MNIKKPLNSRTDYVKHLNANERFVLPGLNTVYVCESRRTMGNMTAVTYRVEGDKVRSEFAKVNLSTVYIIED